MRSLSFGFRDYAVHLFPGCLVVSALLYLFFDFDWVTPAQAPLLVLVYLIGGYIAGFFLDTITTVLIDAKTIWYLSSGDTLDGYFDEVDLNEEVLTPKAQALKVLSNHYGENFVLTQNYKELLYLMMRDVEAANERSAAFLSRINALENMAKNIGISCFWVALILCFNAALNPEQILFSCIVGLFFGVMGLLLLRRRTRYRSWLAKSIVRSFVSLDRQAAIAQAK